MILAKIKNIYIGLPLGLFIVGCIVSIFKVSKSSFERCKLEYRLTVGKNNTQSATLEQLNENKIENWMLSCCDSTEECDKLKSFKVPNWNILLVKKNDESTMKKHGDVWTIGVKELKTYGYKSGYHLTSDDESSLVIASLIAIKNGALRIYFIDPEVKPDASILRLNFQTKRLVSTELLSFNYFLHFGLNERKPDGFLNFSRSPQKHTYFLKVVYTVIEHNVANCKDETSNQLDMTSPPVVIQPQTYSPFVLKGTLFHREAFWALISMVIASGSQSSLGSYWISTLMKYTSGNIMFASQECSHNSRVERVGLPITGDVGVMERVVGDFATWNCRSKDFVSCLKEFSNFQVLRNHSSILGVNLEIVYDFIDDLKRLKYRFPAFVKRPILFEDDPMDILLYYPRVNTPGSQHPMKRLDGMQKTVDDLCPKKFKVSSHLNKSFNNSFYKDIVLVIVFNKKEHANTIQFMNFMYGLNFPNILICGNGNSGRDEAEKYQLSYYPTPVFTYNRQTSNNPKCTRAAMQMGYQVKGYMNIHDDLILNFWNLVSFNTSNIWTLDEMFYVIDIVDKKVVFSDDQLMTAEERVPNWVFFDENMPNIHTALLELEAASWDSTLGICYRKLRQFTKGKKRFVFSQSDIFFIPENSKEKFLTILTKFVDKGIWIETTLGTTLKCMEAISNRSIIPFNHHYYPDKKNVFRSYSYQLNLPYMHPFKMSTILKYNGQKRRVFCEELVPQILTKI